MKKFLASLLAALLVLCMFVPAMAEGVTIGQVEYAAHGTKCFAVLTVAVDGDKIVDAYIDEFQFMGDTAQGVPNSDQAFGENYPEGKVLASKKVNAAMYSENMAKEGSTVALDVNYAAIEAFVTGKTVAELEAAIEGKTKEEMVDAVAGCTLVDTLGYVTGLLEAAKKTQPQVGVYTIYNSTGETVTEVAITTENGNGEKTVVIANMAPDASEVVEFSLPGDVNGHGALKFSFVTESGYEGTFDTLSIETAPINMLAADALTGPTMISFFAPEAK